MTELNDLVGLHKLTGVDFDYMVLDELFDNPKDRNVINFVLDGKTYTAIEDDNDGYRSAMDEIKVSNFKVSNKFKAVKVLGTMREGGYNKHDIIDFIDCITGKIVLSVGTRNTDDYYPTFMNEWKPENLCLNQKDEQS